MQLCGDKRFFAQRVQHNMCGWLAGHMAGENGLFRRGAEPHRAQRRHAADESVHHDGQPFERTAQKHAAQPGNIKAAQRRQHPQRVRDVGVVAGNAAFYRIYFAVQSGIGKSRAAPGHLGHRAAQQHAGHGAGRRCVADAHFPRRQQLCAALLLRAHQRNARGDGLHGLCAGHSRAGGKVSRARSNAAVRRAGHGCARNAHIDGHDVAVGRSGHTADAGAAGGQVFEHGAGHGGIGLADALRHNAVVRAEHQHRAAADIRHGVAGQRGGVLDHGFQPTQSAQRLCQRSPVGVGCGAGGLVRRGNGCKQVFQFVFGHDVSFI